MADHKLNGVLDARDKISRYGLSRSLAKEEKYNFYEELLQPSQLEGFFWPKKTTPNPYFDLPKLLDHPSQSQPCIKLVHHSCSDTSH